MQYKYKHRGEQLVSNPETPLPTKSMAAPVVMTSLVVMERFLPLSHHIIPFLNAQS